jgi:hypothetical protein
VLRISFLKLLYAFMKQVLCFIKHKDNQCELVNTFLRKLNEPIFTLPTYYTSHQSKPTKY